MRCWLWGLLGVLGLIGCNGPNLDTDPLVLAGTGETEYTALSDGVNDMVMANGVQGGTHIWGALRATGVDWSELAMTWTLTDEDGDPVTETTNLRQQLAPCTRSDDACETGMGEIVAVTVILEDPSAVRGDTLTMTIDVSDEAGRTASVTHLVRPIVSIDVN